jgi:hypothetical protein
MQPHSRCYTTDVEKKYFVRGFHALNEWGTRQVGR